MRVTPLGKSASVASALMRHRTMCLRHFETVCGCGEILLGSISPSSYPPFFCVATRPKAIGLQRILMLAGVQGLRNSICKLGKQFN